MLSTDERREIEEEIARYPRRQSGTIEAMRVVQRHRGWVSDEAIADLAELLGLSFEELDGISTFYNLIYREPVGRHPVLVCDSISCWVTGYPRLRAALRDRLGCDLGGTTGDGRFTFLPSVCLGDCDHAPVLMVDEDLHHDLEVDTDHLDERVAAILAGYE